MFNSGPRARPELRRSQSVHQISSYALTLHRETSDSENSVSDLSLDTCFHPNSGHGNSDSENEDNDEEKEEDEEEENGNKKRSNDSDKKEDETSDFLDDSDPELAHDSTHVHQYRRRRRGRRHGDNEDDAALKSMIVTSFRSPKIASKRKVVMRRPSQANDFDAASSFRLDSTILDRRRRLLMTRVESLHSPETNDPPRKVRGTLERGSSSMRNLTTKSREFEDLLGTVTDRDVILQDMDPFLSGDDDPTNHNIKSLRRKSSKRSTTTTTTLTSKERNQVNNNNKQIVLAYDGQEGNLFPEISKEEKAKFQGCGNAWLEGKFSTTADWKRDATGMMLELNINTSKSDDRKNRRKSKDDIHRSSSHEISINHEKENEDDLSLPGECYDIPLQHVISDKDESESVTSRSRQRTSTGDFSANRDNKSLKHRSSSTSHKKQQQQSKDRNHRTKSNRTTDRRMEGKGGVVDEQSDDGSISLAAETIEEDDLRKTSKSRTHHTSRKFKQPQRRISFESINSGPSITESWNAEEDDNDDDNNDKEEVKNKKKEKKQSDSNKFRSEEQGDYPKSASHKHVIPRKMRSMEETSSSYPVESNQGSDDAPTSRNSRSSPRRSSYHHPEQEQQQQPKSSDSKVSSSRRRSDSDGNKKMRSKSVDDTDDSIHDSKSKEPMRKNRTKVLEKKPSNNLDSTNETNKEKEKVSSSRHSKKSPMLSNSKSTSQKIEKRNEKDEDDLVKKSKSSKTSTNRTSKEKVVESDMREKLRLSNKADCSPRKERRVKEQSSPRRDQLPKHTESDLDTSTGAETSRRRRSDTSNQLSDTSGRKASSRSKDDDDIELSNSNFSKVSLTSPSENNNPKDETLLKTDKKQRRRRRSTSVPRNAVDKAVAKLEKELLGTEYDESRKASNRDDDKGISKPSPITLEGCPSVSSDVQDVELTQRLRNTTSVSNTTDIPNSTLTARNAFSQPRRSSSLPRGAEAALQKSIETPNHDNTTTTLRSRNSIRRGSHHQRRRSSSQPRNAEDAFRKSNENQESQQKHHSRARSKEDQTMDRYRSTSVPRDEMMRDAAAAAAVLTEERNRQRREAHSKSSHKRRSSSLPRGVENKHQRDSNVSSSDKVDMVSLATAGPPARRRLSIGGSTYDEPSEDNDAPRPRRRRSLNVGGEVITSGTGEDHPPPTPIRKQNESHQYVQFEEVATTRISLPTASLVSMGMNPNKQTSKGSANSNNGSGKPSFLARFASRFEAETIKPLEKRASMIKQQQQQQEIVPRAKTQDNRMMDRSNVGGGTGAVTSERVVSHHQQMPSTNTTTSKYTPTVTEVPIGNKGTSTYSDLVMQGKIGMMVSNHDTELQE